MIASEEPAVNADAEELSAETAAGGVTTARLPAGTTFEEFVDGLGEPFATYSRALLRAEAADRDRWAAQVADDADALCRAELEWAEATAEVARVAHHEASRLLFAVRMAEAHYPGALRARLGLDDHAERLDAIEVAVAELEVGRGRRAVRA